MATNPYINTTNFGPEQTLVEGITIEIIQAMGQDCVYVPRKYLNIDKVFGEDPGSSFEKTYTIEMYIHDYKGFQGTDIITQFGLEIKDKISLIFARKRFKQQVTDIDSTIIRPREGDLIYFPLGKRLFEIKFVEHEQPFYQLGKTYVYELKCELFEYSDNIGGWDNVNTTVEEIDKTLENQGYINTLKLFPSGSQATVQTSSVSGYVRKITLINDGYNYKTTPTVAISSAPAGGINAQAVAITSCIGNFCSVKEILLVNPGAGYTVEPIVTISSTTGIGATAKAVIEKTYSGIGSITITNSGSGYVTSPSIGFSSPTVGSAVTAVARTIVNSDGQISQVLISDAGIGYTFTPSITISNPPLLVGINTYIFNEVVTGETSGAKSRVKTWDSPTSTLKVGTINGDFIPGEIIVGSISSARYPLQKYQVSDLYDKYEQNDEIQQESNSIVDFSESNLFGNY
jgi:hypothetical protein